MSPLVDLKVDAARCRQMALAERDPKVRATLIALAKHLDAQTPDGAQAGSRHC